MKTLGLVSLFFRPFKGISEEHTFIQVNSMLILFYALGGTSDYNFVTILELSKEGHAIKYLNCPTFCGSRLDHVFV